MNRSSSKLMQRMALCSGGGRGSCCMHLRTLVSRRLLAFSYLWDRMGFWYGQRRLRLIGRSRMQAMFSLVRRSRRPA